jgi:Transposase, Mutator family
LQTPKIRQGSYCPSFLAPRKRSEQALLSVIQQAYVSGVSMRRVDQLVEPWAAGQPQRGQPHLRRPGWAGRGIAAVGGPLRQLFLDAKVEKVRDGGRVQRKWVVIAHGVHETGRREIIALDVGAAETEALWNEFVRGLVAHGLVGVQLVVSDAHERLGNAIAKGAGRAVATLHRAPPYGIAAVVAVPFFAWLVSRLWTRYRAEPPEDPYYSKYRAEQSEVEGFRPEDLPDSTRRARTGAEVPDPADLPTVRKEIYERQRGLYLIHTWLPSERRGQDADIRSPPRTGRRAATTVERGSRASGVLPRPELFRRPGGQQDQRRECLSARRLRLREHQLRGENPLQGRLHRRPWSLFDFAV